jgi:hypothetical protein
LTIKIKNWQKHQHFKDRRPPWIKLYRELLDDPDWHELNGDDAKLLIGMWLVASEDQDMNGALPDTKRLAFRLRISEKQLKQSLTRLSNYLIQDDISVISERYQVDAPETETETETETENRGRGQRQRSEREAETDSSDDAKASRLKNVCVWKSYETAYLNKYGVEPVRNAKTNGQVAQLRKRLGDDAVHVAGWFLNHRNGWYTQKMHSLDCLLVDAEKLRTEWATNTQMTQARASTVDKSTGGGNAFLKIVEEMGHAKVS